MKNRYIRIKWKNLILSSYGEATSKQQNNDTAGINLIIYSQN
ncbi:hypothetical protein [Clostridium cellulovorans]|nr:hypothetical protein [Clostridium cellulovorans]